MASRQLVIFKLNDEDYGVEIAQVSSIEKPMEIFKIPNSPAYIEGLINLRGRVHTVFNLRKKFNLPAKDFDENSKIVITHINNLNLGFIVDEVNEIIRVEDETIENTPSIISTVDREYLNGVAKYEDKLIVLLDLGKVLSLTEAETAQKLQSK